MVCQSPMAASAPGGLRPHRHGLKDPDTALSKGALGSRLRGGPTAVESILTNGGRPHLGC
jgi:hypothetical protein